MREQSFKKKNFISSCYVCILHTLPFNFKYLVMCVKLMLHYKYAFTFNLSYFYLYSVKSEQLPQGA